MAVAGLVREEDCGESLLFILPDKQCLRSSIYLIRTTNSE